MSKKSLSDCFENWEKLLREDKEPTLIVQEIVRRVKKITKEKVRNAEKRLKGEFVYGTMICASDAVESVNEIFKEEFGELSGEK